MGSKCNNHTSTQITEKKNLWKHTSCIIARLGGELVSFRYLIMRRMVTMRQKTVTFTQTNLWWSDRDWLRQFEKASWAARCAKLWNVQMLESGWAHANIIVQKSRSFRKFYEFMHNFQVIPNWRWNSMEHVKWIGVRKWLNPIIFMTWSFNMEEAS